MATLFPQVFGSIARRKDHDIYGASVYGSERAIGVGIVHLIQASQPSSVRADSSASRGRNEDDVIMGTLLLEPKIEPTLGDRITLKMGQYEINSIEPRFDLKGRIRHYECKVKAWVS